MAVTVTNRLCGFINNAGQVNQSGLSAALSTVQTRVTA